MLVSEALVGLLEPRFDVVATVADGRALLKTVKEFEPDVVIVDIAIPMINGLDASRQIRESMPGASCHSMKQVAAELGLTTRMVSFHKHQFYKHQMMEKFRLASNAELV